MKKKKTLFMLLGGVVTASLLTYTFIDIVTEPDNPRSPASIPSNYESLKACEKQEILWGEVQATIHKELPDYRKFGIWQLLALSKQEISIKGQALTDFAPVGWKKYLHGRGAVVKVKIVPKENKYTGLFQGADCGFLRLSLTYKTAGSKPVAPGLALKVLRDGTNSANISALVSLDGQGKDFNFFKYPMSNIVPVGKDIGQKLVHKIFTKASSYPEELLVSDMALVGSHGEKVKEAASIPRQLFFVPGPSLKFISSEHDVREDFLSIPEGTIIYQVHVVSDKYKNFQYGEYTPANVSEFLKESEYVADIVTTSEFAASEFGDEGMFFRHQLRPKE